MTNAVKDEIILLKEEIDCCTQQGLYGEAVGIINKISPELQNQITFFDIWGFLEGIAIFELCCDSDDCPLCSCCCTAFGAFFLIGCCCGTGCRESACNWFTGCLGNCIEGICCNC